MTPKTLAKLMKQCEQGSHEDRMFYLTSLRQLGGMMKRMYKLRPDPHLKENMIWLYNYLNNYDI